MKTYVSCAPFIALAGCVTPPMPILASPSGSFDVHYRPAFRTAADVDAQAIQHCGGVAIFLSEDREADTDFAYRTYRCARS